MDNISIFTTELFKEIRKNELEAIRNIASAEKDLVDAGLVKPEDYLKFLDNVESIINYLRIKFQQ